MFHCSTSSSGFIPTCSSRNRKERKKNEFDEKKCVRSCRTFFLIFDVCNFFLSLFSLFNWRGSCFVAGFGFRRSRRILVSRRSFFVGACRREKGGQKKERPVYLLVPGYSLTHSPL